MQARSLSVGRHEASGGSWSTRPRWPRVERVSGPRTEIVVKELSDCDVAISGGTSGNRRGVCVSRRPALTAALPSRSSTDPPRNWSSSNSALPQWPPRLLLVPVAVGKAVRGNTQDARGGVPQSHRARSPRDGPPACGGRDGRFRNPPLEATQRARQGFFRQPRLKAVVASPWRRSRPRCSCSSKTRQRASIIRGRTPA
jgi:hypothetical protein